MKLNQLVLLGLPLVLFGCPDGDDPPPRPTDTGLIDTGDTDTDTDTDVTPPPAPSFEVTRDASAYTLTVTNPPEGTWYFGWAQTRSGDAGWYGEDCFTGQGSFNFCHPIPATGVLTLTAVDATGDVANGSATLMPLDYDWDWFTYYVGTQENPDNCYVWGDEVAYYASLNCLDPNSAAQ